MAPRKPPAPAPKPSRKSSVPRRVELEIGPAKDGRGTSVIIVENKDGGIWVGLGWKYPTTTREHQAFPTKNGLEIPDDYVTDVVAAIKKVSRVG